jgi:predicted transglutaminase-like cysteine proteinase
LLNPSRLLADKQVMGGSRWLRGCIGFLLGGSLLTGCAMLPAPPPSIRLVEDASPIDAGARAKIAGWQDRERAQSAGDAGISASQPMAPLGESWTQFVSAQRRALAEEVSDWVQAEARAHYVSDKTIDRWPTFSEVVASAGDDCDGLELLALHALRALGFPDSELFRAVIERPRDGMQHMVTLWFEAPGAALVIDPTGFVADRVVPLASLSDWTPRAVFTEHAIYGVEATALAPAGAPD